MIFLPGIIDQLDNHSTIVGQAIEICEDRGDCFLVYYNVIKKDASRTVCGAPVLISYSLNL